MSAESKVKAGGSSQTVETGSDVGAIRGRGGFRSTEDCLIPVGFQAEQLRAVPDTRDRQVELLSNFIDLTPLKDRMIYQYRVDFEPEIDSRNLRKKLFYDAFKTAIFQGQVIFDERSDARSAHKTDQEETVKVVDHPNDPGVHINIKVKRVGIISGGFERTRIYNMNMKRYMKLLEFYQISSNGAYVHPQLSNPVGSTNTLMTVRGFRTAANIHEDGKILMNLESVHKLMQRKNVFEYMDGIRQRNQGGNLQNQLRLALVGKVIVTSYNKIAYRIEDIDFSKNPTSTFTKKNGDQISFIDYYQRAYSLQIRESGQPLLLVIENNKRRGEREAEGGDAPSSREILLVPELCNIAGLTDEQRNDRSLKIDLVRCSQIAPAERVQHIRTFLGQLHQNQKIREELDKWGYNYGKEPLNVTGRVLPAEKIGLGEAASRPVADWSQVDHSASFDRAVLSEKLAVIPDFPKLNILIGSPDAPNERQILSHIRNGLDKVGLQPDAVLVVRMLEGNSAQTFVNHLKRLDKDVTAVMAIMSSQNKERYDAIKKYASVEQGVITQVVTGRLMTDDKKASGAAVKIAIQLAAKIGGEPWFVHLPLVKTMICGYDTHHDTTQRGRSFGAFVASMNEKFTKWYSKADAHDRLDELSSQLRTNLSTALRRYHEVNKEWPGRVILYRDGVSDGQLKHVFDVEVKELKEACVDCCESIKLTVVVVNKRIGARFYLRQNTRDGASFGNPLPGTVIDNVVTRQSRFDFFLVSQSTRHGTVAPTYYSILHDESGLSAARHQAMAYKLCFLYFNWSGTVRVPAPCQYAHKLAFLCGEHLHAVPNAKLDDRLHFL